MGRAKLELYTYPLQYTTRRKLIAHPVEIGIHYNTHFFGQESTFRAMVEFFKSQMCAENFTFWYHIQTNDFTKQDMKSKISAHFWHSSDIKKNSTNILKLDCLNWMFPKNLYWIIIWIEFYCEMNEWIIFWIDICRFWWKAPFSCLFLTLFGQFLGPFPFRPVSMIPWLLNWIIFWIESAEFFWNWIIFWIESWVKQYWIKYWMNHFLAKFQHWIESDWVSATTNPHVNID